MNGMKSMMRNQFGFTLIELMVTVAIVGIVSSLAVAGYLSWKPGYVFRGAVSQIRGDLNRAKMRAVETRRQCKVEFSQNGYQIFDGNQVMASSVWTIYKTRDFTDYPQVIIKDLLVGPPRAVSDIGASKPRVIFSPRGTANNGAVYVEHPNMSGVDISVNTTGRINITWN